VSTSGPDGAQSELLRQFREAIDGLSPSDTSDVIRRLAGLDHSAAARPTRPDRRHAARELAVTYRIRMDLDGSRPPIWRRIDARSDMTLDVVHQIIQAAFGWTDSHLHRFSLGGDPFGWESQLFLCPYDVQEGEDDGVPAAGVRLDEALHETGDVLRYVYDYGDSWELTLRLEDARPRDVSEPLVSLVTGRRAAPPEDSGGGVDCAALSLEVDDPAHFDADEVDRALRAPFFRLHENGHDPRLADVFHRLELSPVGDRLGARLDLLFSDVAATGPDAVAESLQAHRWFLDRARDGGIELTSAGYLKPADVEAVSELVPSMVGWIGKNNRESLAVPLLEFRESLQSSGLLRKYKGTLRLTRSGAAAQRDPERLWQHLAERLAPSDDDRFHTEATTLLLLHAATSAGETWPLEEIAAALAELGWRHSDGRPLLSYELHGLHARIILDNVGPPPPSYEECNRITPAMAALARAALRC
jgi:hypothetical protein